MAQVEIFTPDGVFSGVTPRMPLAPDGPTLELPLTLEQVRWYPLDGAAPSRRDRVEVAPDDILVVVTPDLDQVFHANWYSIVVDLGPYRVAGRVTMPPGFDPDRALTRPGGAFVPLRDATVELRDHPDAGTAERSHVHVNRYAVERVTSPLVLGFFFPGASFVAAEDVPVG